MASSLDWLDPRETLGYGVLSWMEEYLAQPDGPNTGQPLRLVDYQALFVVNLYAINPESPTYKYTRAMLSRPKGTGKSPLLAALCCAELLGPTVLNGYDDDGLPIGKRRDSPYIQIAATSKQQTENTYRRVRGMLNLGKASEVYEMSVGKTRTILPDESAIWPVTASSSALEGQPTTFAVLDETGLWNKSNDGFHIYDAITRNLTKTDGRHVETTNAYVPGEDSVAEKSHEAYKLIAEGKNIDTGFLMDHEEASPNVDVDDRASLRAEIASLYADCPWENIDRIVNDFYDPSRPIEKSERFFLNRITAAVDAWLEPVAWKACETTEDPIMLGDVIALGFDGSRGVTRRGAVADATALVGCRLRDRRVFPIGIWEQPESKAGDDWTPPVNEINDALAEAFADYSVIGLYCDPNGWQGQVTDWENKYGSKLKVKANGMAPCHFWPNQHNRMVRVTAAFESAVDNGELSHDGHPALTRHVLNARRRSKKYGIEIGKESQSSRRKIDAAMAGILALAACNDALQKGISPEGKKKSKLYRW